MGVNRASRGIKKLEGLSEGVRCEYLLQQAELRTLCEVPSNILPYMGVTLAMIYFLAVGG